VDATRAAQARVALDGRSLEARKIAGERVERLGRMPAALERVNEGARAPMEGIADREHGTSHGNHDSEEEEEEEKKEKEKEKEKKEEKKEEKKKRDAPSTRALRARLSPPNRVLGASPLRALRGRRDSVNDRARG